MNQGLKKSTGVALALALLAFSQLANATSDDDLTALVSAFAPDVNALNIPEFDYSYEKNFETVQNLAGIDRQLRTFDLYARKLRRIDRESLRAENRFLYDHFVYELDFNLERVRLEKEFKADYPDLNIPNDGLSKLPNHESWYRLYVRRWSARNISFSEL